MQDLWSVHIILTIPGKHDFAHSDASNVGLTLLRDRTRNVLVAIPFLDIPSSVIVTRECENYISYFLRIIANFVSLQKSIRGEISGLHNEL